MAPKRNPFWATIRTDSLAGLKSNLLASLNIHQVGVALQFFYPNGILQKFSTSILMHSLPFPNFGSLAIANLPSIRQSDTASTGIACDSIIKC